MLSEISFCLWFWHRFICPHKTSDIIFLEYGLLKENAPERAEGYNAVMRRKFVGSENEILKEGEVEKIRDSLIRQAIQKMLKTSKFKKVAN